MSNVRPSRLLRGLLACAAAVTALSGCGTELHPGAAATVDGEAITSETIDDLAQAACDFTEESEKEQGTDDGKPSIAIASLKSSLLNELVGFQLIEDAADKLSVEVPPAQIEQSSNEVVYPEGLGEDQTALLEGYFSDQARSQLQSALIGAKLRDPAITSLSDVTEQDADAAADYLDSYFDDADVDVAPSFGRWDGTAIEAGTGSLSDPVSTTAVESLPPGQNPEVAQAAAEEALAALPPSQVCG